MSLVLIQGHPAVSSLQHVRVIPVSGTGEIGKIALGETDLCHGVVLIANIERSTPEVRTHFGTPLLDSGPTVLAKCIRDGPSGVFERLAHFLIRGLHIRILPDARCAAPVIL